jgi:hypothetical protein
LPWNAGHPVRERASEAVAGSGAAGATRFVSVAIH